MASDSEEDMSQDEDEAEQVSRSSKLPQHKVNMKMVNDWTTKIQVRTIADDPLCVLQAFSNVTVFFCSE